MHESLKTPPRVRPTSWFCVLIANSSRQEAKALAVGPNSLHDLPKPIANIFVNRPNVHARKSCRSPIVCFDETQWWSAE